MSELNTILGHCSNADVNTNTNTDVHNFSRGFSVSIFAI